MNTLLMLVVALILSAIAVYAHVNLRRFTHARWAELLTRVILIGTGCGLGYIYALQHRGDVVLAVLALVIGLGSVHFPASIILFVKGQRGSGRS